MSGEHTEVRARRWTLHGEHVEITQDERDGLVFEPEAWTTPAWVEGDLDRDEEIKVMSVAEHEYVKALLAAIRRRALEADISELRGYVLGATRWTHQR